MIVDARVQFLVLRDHPMRPCPLPLCPLAPKNTTSRWHLRTEGKTSAHISTRTHLRANKRRELWHLVLTGPYHRYRTPPPHLPSAPSPLQPSSDPPHVTNVCCLGPSLRLGRELSIFIFLSFFGSLVWMTKNGLLTYKYLSSVKIRGKDCSSVIVVGSFNPFLALTCTVRRRSRVQFKDFATWGHIYTVGGISPAPETLLWCFELVIFVSRLKIPPRSLYALIVAGFKDSIEFGAFQLSTPLSDLWDRHKKLIWSLILQHFSVLSTQGISPWRPVQVKIATLQPSPSVIFLQAHLTPRTGKG